MHRRSFFGTLAGAFTALVAGKVASADDIADDVLRRCTKECRYPFNPGPCRFYEDVGPTRADCRAYFNYGNFEGMNINGR